MSKRNLVPCCLVLLIALFVLPCSTASAFNGLHKGFVLGGGIGYAPVVKWKIDFFNIDESKTGTAGDFVIGYGFSESNIITFNVNGISFRSDELEVRSTTFLFLGPTWYHFWTKLNGDIYTSIGIGRFGVYNNNKGPTPGWGYTASLGYEFVRHFYSSVILSGGRTRPFNDSDDKATHFQVSIVLGVVGY